MVLFAVIVNSQISSRRKTLFVIWLGYEYISRMATSEYLPIFLDPHKRLGPEAVGVL